MAKNMDTEALIGALIAGPLETPLWRTFLDTLRKATKADYAGLFFRAPGMPLSDGLQFYSGDISERDVQEAYRQYVHPLRQREHETMLEGRPYSLEELAAGNPTLDPELYQDLIRALKVSKVDALRQMRIQEASGVNALLTISRRGKDFTAEESALLATTAAALRGVLALYIARERERYAASLTS